MSNINLCPQELSVIALNVWTLMKTALCRIQIGSSAAHLVQQAIHVKVRTLLLYDTY